MLKVSHGGAVWFLVPLFPSDVLNKHLQRLKTTVPQWVAPAMKKVGSNTAKAPI